MLPGFEQGIWLAGGFVAMVAAVAAVVPEEEDAGYENEGAKDGGKDSGVDV